MESLILYLSNKIFKLKKENMVAIVMTSLVMTSLDKTSCKIDIRKVDGIGTSIVYLLTVHVISYGESVTYILKH